MKKGNWTKRSKQSNASSKSASRASLAKTHTGLVFVRRFQNALAQSQAIPRGSKVVVAVSGGPDSMALLTVLARLRQKHDFTIHVAHVNYGLRGLDSKRDESLVEKMAVAYGLPFSVSRPRIKARSNVEEVLRDIRYAYFEKLRIMLGFDVVATAHTMNDVAETFLLNLMRGSGLAGLSPFSRSRPNIVRPLLVVNKSDILEFLKAEQVPYRIDKSNFSKRFTRNRIRHELLPLMSSFNPAIVETLSETAKRLGEAAESEKHET